MSLQPDHLELVGDFFAIRWNDGQESVIGLADLRRACPCALCVGEPDVTGAVRMPTKRVEYVESSFQLTGFEQVGHYAVAFSWGDGHNSGIYSWELLRGLGS
jgi:DUF971 family protein